MKKNREKSHFSFTPQIGYFLTDPDHFPEKITDFGGSGPETLLFIVSQNYYRVHVFQRVQNPALELVSPIISSLGALTSAGTWIYLRNAGAAPSTNRFRAFDVIYLRIFSSVGVPQVTTLVVRLIIILNYVS